MADFFVDVFGRDSYIQYRIKDLIANSFNGIVSDEYAFDGVRFYFPVVYENDEFYIDDRNRDWEFTINGEKLSEKRLLKDGDYIIVTGKRGSLAILVEATERCSLDSTVYGLENGRTYFLGRSEDSNVVLDNSMAVSRKHASVRMDASGNAVINDVSGRAGVFVNGSRVTEAALCDGDHVFIMGTTIIFYKNKMIIPSVIKTNGLSEQNQIEPVELVSDADDQIFVRTSRIMDTLDTEPVAIDTPPSPKMPKEMPFILQAGPSITMALAMVASLGVSVSRILKTDNGDYTSVIPSAFMVVSMLLGALLWPKLSRSYTRRQAEALEKKRQQKYRVYLDEKEHSLRSSYERNTRLWNESLFPTGKVLIDTIEKHGRHLWERSYTDDDFLEIRLGTGNRPFEVETVIKKRGFELDEDILEDEAYELADKYQELQNVPITLSLLNHKVTGVIEDYTMIARGIITNLVSLYSPDEVKIVLVYNRSQESELRKFNDLPHMWSSDRTVRYVAASRAEAYTLFGHIDEQIEEREGTLGKDDPRIPYFVVMVFDETMLEGVPFKKNLVDGANKLGVSGIFFGKRFNQIPKECSTIIQKNNEVCGIYIKGENNNHLLPFDTDEVTEDDIGRLVKGISEIHIRQEKSQSNVPERVSFLEMYRVGNVDALNIESRWNSNNSDRTLAAPIGVMAGGDVFSLDIHEKYHGCHGLVAGTTGSGKSEFLQAYILSMMINYSPDEVAFVLVDFKGGDMARPFLKSPHLAATISNLSGNTLYRALVSLQAEVANRQRIFNESASMLGIDKIDINSYQKYFKEHKLDKPLPHLVIVIDEFAQLKTQHPEFMAKLIDVAQVGRSLGIHLILATQKPSGVVDPQIWSNSRFKVCLKVMDKEDSKDMINRPVAAMIKNPGRAYVQVGYDEVFELIQSGYSGADYIPQDSFIEDDSVTVSMVSWPGEKLREARDENRGAKTGRTQLEEVMTKVEAVGESTHKVAAKLWLDPLPEKLRFESLEIAEEDFGEVTIGRMDLPQIQQQINYSVNFVKNGHLAIYGAAGTGKSTMLQTIFYAMAQKYTPKEFNSFILDFNGGSLIALSKMPHCADYATDDNDEKVQSLISKIRQAVKDRRAAFVKAGCANYDSYRKAGHKDMPLVLAVIDNYVPFKEKYYNLQDDLVQLIASSGSCGIYFIITGNSKNAIYFKTSEQVGNIISFNMTDRDDYMTVMRLSGRPPIEPEKIKGRALVAYKKIVAEMQVAVPYDADSETDRMAAVNELYKSLTEKYGKTVEYAEALPDIPMLKVEDDDVEVSYQKPSMKHYAGVDGADQITVGTDMRTGEAVKFSLETQGRIFVCDRDHSAETVSAFIKSVLKIGKLVRIFSRRRDIDAAKPEMYIEDLDAYMNAQGEDDVLIIDGFSDFYSDISDEALDVFEKSLKNNPERKVITFDSMADIEPYKPTGLYVTLVRTEAGVVMKGGVDDTLAFALENDLSSIPEEYRTKGIGTGRAFVYYKDTATYATIGGDADE